MTAMLKVATPPEWVTTALKDFDAFLLDHAACERKASAVGMSFVVRYPDRPLILEPMIQFAREELEHYHQVMRLCLKRGLVPERDEHDEYVNLLMKEVRFGREERFLDRLLASALIEARGAERLALVTDRLTDPELRNFYSRLARAEEHHREFFIEMARLFFPQAIVDHRLAELAEVEARAIQSVPHRSALH